MKTAAIIISTLALSACTAPRQMVKADHPMTADQRDRAACDYEADKAIAGERNVFIANRIRGELFESCMRARGYVAEARR